jgi:calcium/proton exchanger
VGIQALRQNEISVVQSSMVGSVLSSILMVKSKLFSLHFSSSLTPVEILGACFLFAGWGEFRLKFQKDVSSLMSSLMVVSSASLLVPSAMYATTAPSDSGGPDDNVLVLSYVTSIILLAFYLLYLYFQIVSHADVFLECEEDEGGDRTLGIVSSSLFLLLATLGVTVCSDSLVDSIDGLVETLHISRAFVGLIIVPIVGNAGELTTAVSAAMSNKLNLAIGLVVSSTLQIALFVTPFLVIMGWIIGKPMSLRFDSFETIVFSLAVLVVSYLIQDGRTNYFAGALLIGT